MPDKDVTELPVTLNQTMCRHCKLEIAEGAAVCPHCRHYQSRWRNFTEPAILISFCLLILSGFQLYSANTQIKLAQVANNNAQTASIASLGSPIKGHLVKSPQ